MITQEQLKDLQQRKEDLKRYLDIDGKKIEVEEEELRTHVPDFWQDQKAAEAQMKKIKSLRNWINGCEEVELSVDEVTTGFDFVKEGLIEEGELDELYKKALVMLEKLELRNMLRHDEDKMDAILKINSGAGGTESQDWASMLMRMYLRWCERHGYKTAIEHIIDGDEAGIKSVTISIEGDFAYGYLKSENGVHRLVRVSPYNAQGKRMTSFASVFVTPLVDDTIEITLDPARISWDTFRSGGAGGQNVNKVESGVRVACASATSIRTPTPARKRKSWSRTPKHATSPRTARTPCATCAPSSTTRSSSTDARSSARSRTARRKSNGEARYAATSLTTDASRTTAPTTRPATWAA